MFKCSTLVMSCSTLVTSCSILVMNRWGSSMILLVHCSRLLRFCSEPADTPTFLPVACTISVIFENENGTIVARARDSWVFLIVLYVIFFVQHVI